MCVSLLHGETLRILHESSCRFIHLMRTLTAIPCRLPKCAAAPRLKLSGQMGALAEFSAALLGKDLDKGAEVILTWRPDGKLEVTVQPPSASGALTGPKSTADAVVASVALCRALFEVRQCGGESAGAREFFLVVGHNQSAI